MQDQSAILERLQIVVQLLKESLLARCEDDELRSQRTGAVSMN